MKTYEEQYMELLKNIYFNGFSDGKTKEQDWKQSDYQAW